MLEGRVREAIRLLSDNTSSRLLNLDVLPVFPEDPSAGSVWDHLLMKHPFNNQSQPIDPSVILLPSSTLRGVWVTLLVKKLIKFWCICSSYGSIELCSSLAAVTWHLCSIYIDPRGHQSLLFCHLWLSVEVCQGIMCSTVLIVLCPDVMDTKLQLCAGERSGCEAVVHTMRHIFQNWFSWSNPNGWC